MLGTKKSPNTTRVEKSSHDTHVHAQLSGRRDPPPHNTRVRQPHTDSAQRPRAGQQVVIGLRFAVPYRPPHNTPYLREEGPNQNSASRVLPVSWPRDFSVEEGTQGKEKEGRARGCVCGEGVCVRGTLARHGIHT